MFCFIYVVYLLYFFFQAEDGIRDGHVTGVQTCALPISFMKIHQMEYDDILQSELPLVVADMEGENAFRFHWPQNGILVMGNEGKGRSEERRVGKSVKIGSGREIKKKKQNHTLIKAIRNI